MTAELKQLSLKEWIFRSFVGIVFTVLIAAIGASLVFDLPGDPKGVIEFLAYLRFWGAITMGPALPWVALHVVATECIFAIFKRRRVISILIGMICGAAGGYWMVDPAGPHLVKQIWGCSLTGAFCGWVYWWWILTADEALRRKHQQAVNS